MSDVRKVAIDVIEKFIAAKAWVASDSYDGIDARGRDLLEDADSAAKQFLASLPAAGEAWYPSVDAVLERTECDQFAIKGKECAAIIRATADLILERGGQAQWKPIAEAPRDGREILATGHDGDDASKRRHYAVVSWSGSYWTDSGDASRMDYLTHYQPLPTAPEDEPK